MRDILTDLESSHLTPDPDPVRRARKLMQTQLPKRFYGEVTVSAEDDGHKVLLDGRAARTPTGSQVTLPNQQAAALVAHEYDAQKEQIDPAAMPVTRLVNTAIDGVAKDTQSVAEDILRYASSDLLVYRAEGPEKLKELQAEAWEPVLDWAETTFGGRFVLAEGVMHIEQPRETIAAVSAHLRSRREPLRLAALHVMTTLTGSSLLALAVEARAIDAEEAWQAAHVDEDWNISQWGEDPEEAARRNIRRRDMFGAVALLEALDEGSSA